MTNKMKLIVSQVVESIYKYFDLVRISSSQVIYLHTAGPKVQEVQYVVNTQVRWEFTVVNRMYIVVRLYDTEDRHVVCCVVKITTSIEASNSYVKCGPRILKLLRLMKMTLKWQGTGKVHGSHLVWGWLWVTVVSCQWVGQEKVRPSPSQAQVDHLEITYGG